MNHVQCRLQCDQMFQVSWIPEKFAVLGKRLILDGDPGEWKVIAKYATKPSKEIQARSQDYRNQRKVSDI